MHTLNRGTYNVPKEKIREDDVYEKYEKRLFNGY